MNWHNLYVTELCRYFDYSLQHYGNRYCRDQLELWRMVATDKRCQQAKAYQVAVGKCEGKLL